MKNFVIIGIIVILITSVLSVQMRRIRALKIERDKYRSNTETLLKEVMSYKTKDNLNAVKVGVLELQIKEYEKYRADDLALIKSLQTKNSRLQNATTLQLKTVSEIHTFVKDSIIYRKSEIGQSDIDTLRCISVKERWFELEGCIDKDNVFTGVHTNYEALLIAVTAYHKRFLGFLWRTNRIKSRDVNAVSRNPNTVIEKIEYVEIRK